MKARQYARHATGLIRIDDICSMDTSELSSHGRVWCWMRGTPPTRDYMIPFEGIQMVELLMVAAPHALEGTRGFRSGKWNWAFHNLVAHPLMWLLVSLGLRGLAFKVHDTTIPAPKGWPGRK